MKKPVLALAALLLVRIPAPAQVESALLSKVTFNLTNPGGKSLAMGGAFTAIADDATAGIANPAHSSDIPIAISDIATVNVQSG